MGARALIALGMAAGFILSRSVGLPGFHETDWELSGIVSVLLEVGFVGAISWHAQTSAGTLAQATSN